METKFSEKELHCLARILQGCFYGPENNPFYGCQYCKYGLDCCDVRTFRWNSVRDKIENATNVNLSILLSGSIEKKFLQESFQELYPEEYKKLKVTK